MVQEQVNIARVGTMADGSIRLTLDILGGTGEVMRDLFNLKTRDVTVILVPTEDLQNEVTDRA